MRAKRPTRVRKGFGAAFQQLFNAEQLDELVEGKKRLSLAEQNRKTDGFFNGEIREKSVGLNDKTDAA